MKQPGFNLVLCGVFSFFIVCIYWFYQQMNTPVQPGITTIPAARNIAVGRQGNTRLSSTEQAFSTNTLLGFDYKIITEVINEDQALLTNSVFTGKLVLKRTVTPYNKENGEENNKEKTDSKKQRKTPVTWLGQIREGKLSQQGKMVPLEQAILFTTDYQDFVFNNIDLLGLDSSHPANAIRYLLKQVSYDLSQALTIETATDIVRYRYRQSNNQLSRELESRKILTADNAQALNMSVEKITEHWQLTLDNNALPGKLENVLNRYYQNQDRQFVVKQRLSVTALDAANLEQIDNWQDGGYTAKANSKLVYQAPGLNTVVEIHSQQALLQALAKLAALPDERLAQAIGKYLIDHYSADALVKLLQLLKNNGAKNHDQLASLVIYSIQKNPVFAAEVMLVDLLEHPELNTLNKQRVIMSLGRFEAVSEHGLNRLQQLAESSDRALNHTLANTAQLSIGTVARYNQEQKQAISRYLSGQLTQSENKAVILLAINNTGLSLLNEQAAHYLGDKSAAVNVALIKLLVKDPGYHQRLIDYAIVSDQAKTIHALGRALAAKQLMLSPAQEQQILAQINKTQTQVVKDQLLALLADEEQSW